MGAELPPPDGPVLVCGLGRVGSRVIDFLRRAGVPVALLDRDADPADSRFAGVSVTKGDARDPRALAAAGAVNARGVVICTSDDLTNVACALAVRRLNPSGRIVVRMFNQALITRLAGAVRNTTALSVSALTAPLLVVSALTGDSLGAFPAGEAGTMRVAEASAAAHAGRRVADVAGQFRVVVVAHSPASGTPRLFADVRGDDRLMAGDTFTVCGAAADVEALVAPAGDPLTGVYWAGRVRRAWRTAARAVSAVDTSVKLGTAALFGTLLVSTLVFRLGLGTTWADGLYQSVSVVATATDLKGDARPEWAKLFLSVLKIAGAALVAAFTAILTQYLLRAKLGGAFEVRKIPESGHVVVAGLGNVGFRCVEELVALGCRVVAIERDAQAPFAATVRRMKVAVVAGDATVPAVLDQVRAHTARAVIAATSSELANLEIGLLAREKNPNQRVVVRLADPEFAEAVRASTGLSLAVSVPALAAPAFAAALSGDRVRTLVPVAGRTLAVAELVVQAADPCFFEVPLAAAMVDYAFLPVAVAGQPPFPADGIPRAYRLQANDRLTVLVELDDLARILRREPAPRDCRVVVEALPPLAAAALVPVLRTARGCGQAEAEELVKHPPFTLADGLSRGAAEELLGRAARERASGRVERAT